METRSFQYTDAKSNKFWTITLEGSSHTVSYGRIGASPKTETKTFSTSYLAKQSYEKLIQQKLSKGYIEVNQETQPVVENTENKISEQQDKEAIRAEVKSTDKLEITRVLNLNPEDYRFCTWRPRNPLPRPEIKAINQEEAIKHLYDIKHPNRDCLDWNKANISVSVSREEANFWLSVMTHKGAYQNRIPVLLSELFTDLQKVDFAKESSFNEILSSIIRCQSTIYDEIDKKVILPLASFFGVVEIIVAFEKITRFNEAEALEYAYLIWRDEPSYQGRIEQSLGKSDSQWVINHAKQELVNSVRGSASRVLTTLLRGINKYLLHYQTDEELDNMRSSLRPLLVEPVSQIRIDPLINLAAILNMHDKIHNIVTSWSDDFFVKNNSNYCSINNEYNFIELCDLVFALGDSQLILDQIHRLKLQPFSLKAIRIYLATTEFNTLDLICLGIAKTDKDGAKGLLETLISVAKVPEMAPYMLELVLESQASALARRWLEDNYTYAIVGLIPIAAGTDFTPVVAKKTQLIEAATQFLRTMIKKGHKDIIRVALEQENHVIVNKIKTEVLEHKEITSVPFDEDNTPEWLTIRTTDSRNFNTKNIFKWVKPSDLPPLLVGNNNCLNNEQVATCLFALHESTLDSPHPLVKNLKTHCNPQSLDNFIWSLFQRWLTEGAPSKEKWAMMALGLLGSDNIALKLVPLIRTWPGESQHSRAVFGLECLRAIGTDTALMQIHGISQKIKYQGLKKRASECLRAIAKQRKLTPEELEDRIIPDFGLDARGKRVFDFGGRQFHFALSADLKPLVRDEKGKLSGSLPKPGAKDNTELANQAIADWKLLKKQIDQTIKIQSVRLEKAMITARRWKEQEFDTLFVRHPFMTHLAQRLVWGSYDANNQLIATFRVAEDQTYADAADEEYIPSNVTSVSVIHPINLTTEQRAVWGQALSDYEIIPPFPQINREIYTLQPEEREHKEITRFKDIQIPGITLARTMENLGWVRGGLHDHGDYQVHYKYFACSNITAITGDYENQHVEQNSIHGNDAIDGCCFFTGSYQPDEYPAPGSWYHRNTAKEHVILGDVEPLVLSEVLRDLYIVTAKTNK